MSRLVKRLAARGRNRAGMLFTQDPLIEKPPRAWTVLEVYDTDPVKGYHLVLVEGPKPLTEGHQLVHRDALNCAMIATDCAVEEALNYNETTSP